jgi:hypothetical protein
MSNRAPPASGKSIMVARETQADPSLPQGKPAGIQSSGLQLPGQLPNQLPGQLPPQLPRAPPTLLPRPLTNLHVPGQLPMQLPMQLPGQLPEQRQGVRQSNSRLPSQTKVPVERAWGEISGRRWRWLADPGRALAGSRRGSTALLARPRANRPENRPAVGGAGEARGGETTLRTSALSGRGRGASSRMGVLRGQLEDCRAPAPPEEDPGGKTTKATSALSSCGRGGFSSVQPTKPTGEDPLAGRYRRRRHKGSNYTPCRARRRPRSPHEGTPTGDAFFFPVFLLDFHTFFFGMVLACF